jgi:hypothetical protein
MGLERSNLNAAIKTADNLNAAIQLTPHDRLKYFKA